MRKLAMLIVLLAAMAIGVPAMAQTEPPRLAVTATSDHCAGGLPVVDYTVTNRWPTAVSTQIWWVADAWVYDVAGKHDLGPAPDSVSGSFTLPFDFYTTVTVFVTAFWADGEVTTNASWAIPVADCAAPAPPPTTVPEPTTTAPATTAPTTTVDDGNGNGNGNGNGHGNGPPTTAEAG
jgi:hypothetical protein